MFNPARSWFFSGLPPAGITLRGVRWLRGSRCAGGAGCGDHAARGALAAGITLRGVRCLRGSRCAGHAARGARGPWPALWTLGLFVDARLEQLPAGQLCRRRAGCQGSNGSAPAVLEGRAGPGQRASRLCRCQLRRRSGITLRGVRWLRGSRCAGCAGCGDYAARGALAAGITLRGVRACGDHAARGTPPAGPEGPGRPSGLWAFLLTRASSSCRRGQLCRRRAGCQGSNGSAPAVLEGRAGPGQRASRLCSFLVFLRWLRGSRCAGCAGCGDHAARRQ